MDEIREAYDSYLDKAKAVVETGKKILDSINDNLKSIERYKGRLKEEQEAGKDGAYFQDWIDELTEENEMLADIERYHRTKYLKDARQLYVKQEEAEVW